MKSGKRLIKLTFCAITFAVLLILGYLTVHTETNFNEYLSQLNTNIKRNWEPPNEEYSRKTVALFKVAKDGSLISSQILESSGNVYFDNEALKAIARSFPFKSLPNDFRGKSIDVQFTFERKVNGKTPYTETEKRIQII